MEKRPWREILVDVEAANRNFRVGIQPETTVRDVLHTLTQRCQEEGLALRDWIRSRSGVDRASLVLLRKSEGSTAVPPGTSFGRLEPSIREEERFSLDARAVVG